jgi:hypothetical protein
LSLKHPFFYLLFSPNPEPVQQPELSFTCPQPPPCLYSQKPVGIKQDPEKSNRFCKAKEKTPLQKIVNAPNSTLKKRIVPTANLHAIQPDQY